MHYQYTMENRIQSFLTELGLSRQESEAYDIALGLGTFAASTLGTRLGVPRSTARYTCEALVQKGLMIETKRANTKLFVAENPTKLYAILYAEEENLQRKKNQLTVTIKELQQKYNPEAKLPKITFYEGADGIERMFDELMTHSTPLYSFGAGDYFLEKEPNLVRKYRNKSEFIHNKVYALRAKKYAPLHTKPVMWVETKYYKYLDELKIDFQITDDVVAISSLEDGCPIGILIKHRAIVEGFQQIFQEMWLLHDDPHRWDESN